MQETDSPLVQEDRNAEHPIEESWHKSVDALKKREGDRQKKGKEEER